jgi:hypothetical protein
VGHDLQGVISLVISCCEASVADNDQETTQALSHSFCIDDMRAAACLRLSAARFGYVKEHAFISGHINDSPCLIWELVETSCITTGGMTLIYCNWLCKKFKLRLFASVAAITCRLLQTRFSPSKRIHLISSGERAIRFSSSPGYETYVHGIASSFYFSAAIPDIQ